MKNRWLCCHPFTNKYNIDLRRKNDVRNITKYATTTNTLTATIDGHTTTKIGKR